MALIEWNKERFSVQVKQFDDEHQELVRLINDLHAAMKSGKSREVIGHTLHELVDYTKTHFCNEEAFMARHGYPEMGPHRKEHVELSSASQSSSARLPPGRPRSRWTSWSFCNRGWSTTS